MKCRVWFQLRVIEALMVQETFEFLRVFSRREQPQEIAELPVPVAPSETVDLVGLLVSAGLAKTKNEARRLLRQKGVKLNGITITETTLPLARASGGVLQVGPRHFRKLVSH